VVSNDTHRYLERRLVNYVYCVIISDVVLASTTNIKSLLNMHDGYALYTIQQLTHAYVLTPNVVLALSFWVLKYSDKFIKRYIV
jgi:hypothetical protein